MSTEIVVALVGIIGIIMGALVNQLLARKKTEAEIDKIKAETEKVRAESYKIRAEIPQLEFPATSEIINQNVEKISVVPIVAINLTINTSAGYKEHPSPAEIVLALDKLREYQIDSMLENYRDLKIKWHLILFFVNVNSEPAHITCKSSKARNTTIMFEVKIADYPELNLVKKGQFVWVSGIISRISRIAGYVIYLSDCLLEIE
jgi:hypothetical protein